MKNKHTIEILKIFVSNGHNFKGRYGKTPLRHAIQSVESVECVAGQGLKGDRFFGYKDDYKGQITFIGQATIDAVARRTNRIAADPALFRRNVVVSGCDLNGLIGKRFRLGPVLLSGAEECSPCFWMDEMLGDGAVDEMLGRGGLRCRILESGLLRVGAEELQISG